MRAFDLRLVPLILLVLIGSALAAPPASSAPQWYTDYAQAEAAARQLQRPLLVHFYADWCGPCRRMEREVLRSPEVLEQIGDRFIAVKVNTDNHQALAKRFGVHSLPSDVFVEPDGRVMAQTTGFQERRTYLARMARLEADFARTHKTQIVKLPVRDEEPILAPVPAVRSLDGYSPVSLWNWREWRRGTQEFAVTHQGMEFHLASADEVTQFQANPDRYVPRLLGCDPVVLWETERAVPGSTKFGAYFDGELFLFTTADARRRFRESPKQFTETRHVLRVDQIDTTQLR